MRTDELLERLAEINGYDDDLHDQAAAEIRRLSGLVDRMSALVTGMADYAMHVMPAQHGKAVCDDYARATAIAATLAKLEPKGEG